MIIKNAVIERTMLGTEDHGVMTAYLHLSYGKGSGQSFGGYGFDNPNEKGNWDAGRIGTVYGCEFIRRVLEVVGRDTWEALPGTHIRVKSPDTWGSTIIAIGHILEDKWFNPKELVEELKARSLSS